MFKTLAVRTRIIPHLTSSAKPLLATSKENRGLSTVVDIPDIVKLSFHTENADFQLNAHIGNSLLQEAKRSNVNIAGICEGKKVCNSCHVHLDPRSYSLVGEPSEEEVDIFDLATGISDVYVPGRSRLCCQIKVTDALQGADIFIPHSSQG
ncbi:Adrenodoxin-like protein [Smittium mucronatum]|uniref:Adrenodoxin-like protein n=1 Tax=Smittium mucronatum TaxID=133383 RepID=A0A1R0H5A4_9FUNG|nr:Adrenodoxin-like protein [Smittium mucronatum]